MQQLLYSALKNLVELKERKETIGKDDYYLNEQPIAWEEAKRALRKHEIMILLLTKRMKTN